MSRYKYSDYNKKYCQEHKGIRNFNRNHWQHKIRLAALSHYSGGTLKCARCGIGDIDVLCIDHIEGDGYKDKRKQNLTYNLKKDGYPEGYQVLCANCNLKKAKQLKELERRSIPKL